MTTPPLFEIDPETAPPDESEWRLPPGLRYSLPAYAFKPWVKLGHPIRLFEYLHRVFGNIAQYRLFNTYIVFVNDPEFIREILINQASSFVKERTLKRMKILLGEGLITSDDPIHIRQRRIAAPAFHRQRISAYADQIVASAAAQRDRWQPGQTVDIASAMMELSLEIVARTLFDTEVTGDIRAINEDTNAIMGLYNFLVGLPMLESYLDWPIPGVIKFRRCRDRLNRTVDRLIAEHKQAFALTGKDKGDLLSMLLSSRDVEVDAEGNHTGMSDKQVRDEVLTIFLAGYETVANALTWTWYLLTQNPEAQARLHAELDAVLEGGRVATLADYPNLHYTEQVFAEAMRLYPPAWAMGRMSTRPVTLGPWRIPPGAHFFFSQYIMHRSAEYFPEPLRFDPDRHTPENKAGRPKFAYFPFGGGGRQCIGEAFAWMEGVLALATLASRWRMEYLGTEPPVPQARITLRPRDPLMVRLIPR